MCEWIRFVVHRTVESGCNVCRKGRVALSYSVSFLCLVLPLHAGDH